MHGSITTAGFPLKTLQQTYLLLEDRQTPPPPPVEDPRHERLVEHLHPEQYPEPVQHWAVPFHTLAVQLLHSMEPGALKRTAFRHLLEAQVAAVQSHWDVSCLYCLRAMDFCGCKEGAVR